MAILDKVNLDFHVFSTGDPKVLVVMDTSVWGFIEDKNAAIEITLPGSTKVKRFNYLKSKTNVFNSSNLLITPIGEYKDLADGVYRIDLFGAHGNCFHRDYLKTDKAKLEMYKIYSGLGIDNSDDTKRKKKIIQDIDLLIRASEGLVSRGQLKKGMMFFKEAIKKINDYNQCKDCK